MGDFQRILAQLSGSLHGLPEPLFADRFQQIIHRSGFERLDGVLVERGDDHDHGQVSAAQFPHHFEAAHDRHLEVEQHQVRLERGDLLQGLLAVLCLPDDHHVRNGLQFLPQHAPRDGLIVHDEGLSSRADPSSVTCTPTLPNGEENNRQRTDSGHQRDRNGRDRNVGW